MRIATVGSNVIVDRFIGAARSVPEIELAAAYSRTEEQARTNQAKWGAGAALWHWEDLLASDQVEAVYVATPNICHFDQARDLLNAGKHVMLEKPATMTADEFSALCRIAEEKHLAFMEMMRPAHLPFLPQLREAMAELGTIRYADFPYCQYSSRYDKFQRGIIENAFNPAMGGGALTDIAVYCIAWMEQLLGVPDEVIARTVRLPDSIDGVTVLTNLYPGAVAVVSGSKIHTGWRPCVIEGEKGSLSLEPFPIPEKAVLRLKSGSVREIPLVSETNDMVHEVRDFLAGVRGERDLGADRQHTLNVLRILDAAKAQI